MIYKLRTVVRPKPLSLHKICQQILLYMRPMLKCQCMVGEAKRSIKKMTRSLKKRYKFKVLQKRNLKKFYLFHFELCKFLIVNKNFVKECNFKFTFIFVIPCFSKFHFSFVGNLFMADCMQNSRIIFILYFYYYSFQLYVPIQSTKETFIFTTGKNVRKKGKL